MARARGFTLVEVLVALVIVALGMGAALAALSGAADGASRMRERMFAQWIAFNQISTARLARQMPAVGTSSDKIPDFANGRWKWTQTVTQLDTPGIYRIEVKVRRDDGADDAHANWLADVSGFRGDALAGASGELPNWNGTATNGNPPASQTPAPATTPAPTTTPVPTTNPAPTTTPAPMSPLTPGSGG